MATITKARARKPFTDGSLYCTASGQNREYGETFVYQRFSLCIHGDDGISRLDMNREEATQMVGRIVRMLTTRVDSNGYTRESTRVEIVETFENCLQRGIAPNG